MSSVFLTGTAGQSTDQPGAPTLPAIPDLDGSDQGLQSTVQALVDNVRTLSNQIPGNNNTVNQSSGTTTKQQTNAQKKQSQIARFTELSRQTQQVTVTDPSSGASLTYTQITQLVMQDNVTKELWTWNL